MFEAYRDKLRAKGPKEENVVRAALETVKRGESALKNAYGANIYSELIASISKLFSVLSNDVASPWRNTNKCISLLGSLERALRTMNMLLNLRTSELWRFKTANQQTMEMAYSVYRDTHHYAKTLEGMRGKFNMESYNLNLKAFGSPYVTFESLLNFSALFLAPSICVRTERVITTILSKESHARLDQYLRACPNVLISSQGMDLKQAFSCLRSNKITPAFDNDTVDNHLYQFMKSTVDNFVEDSVASVTLTRADKGTSRNTNIYSTSNTSNTPNIINSSGNSNANSTNTSGGEGTGSSDKISRPSASTTNKYANISALPSSPSKRAGQGSGAESSSSSEVRTDGRIDDEARRENAWKIRSLSNHCLLGVLLRTVLHRHLLCDQAGVHLLFRTVLLFQEYALGSRLDPSEDRSSNDQDPLPPLCSVHTLASNRDVWRKAESILNELNRAVFVEAAPFDGSGHFPADGVETDSTSTFHPPAETLSDRAPIPYACTCLVSPAERAQWCRMTQKKTSCGGRFFVCGAGAGTRRKRRGQRSNAHAGAVFVALEIPNVDDM